MPTWKELEDKKGRSLTYLRDHLRKETLLFGVIAVVVAAILELFSPNVTLSQTGFVLLGVGAGLVATETINAVDRRSNYLRERTGEERLYSVAEQTLSNSRVAAQLAVCLYYWCVEGEEQQERRARLLSVSLGISDLLPEVVESARMLPLEALGRFVPRVLAERKGAQVEGAYSATLFLMFIAQADSDKRTQILRTRQERFSAIERVTSGMRKQGSDSHLVRYVGESLDKWIDNKCSKLHIELLCHVLRIYLSLFQDVDLPSRVTKFLENPPSIEYADFIREAKEALMAYDRNDKTGTLRIEAGSGSLRDIHRGSKVITVAPLDIIRGQLTIRSENLLPDYYQTPLILVTSWAPSRSSFRTVSEWIPTGDHLLSFPVEIQAPSEPGEYYLLVSFDGQTTPAYVSSLTDWRFGYPVWRTTNDLSRITSDQVKMGQETGSTEVVYLFTWGYGPSSLPLDAVRIVVKKLGASQSGSTLQ